MVSNFKHWIDEDGNQHKFYDNDKSSYHEWLNETGWHREIISSSKLAYIFGSDTCLKPSRTEITYNGKSYIVDLPERLISLLLLEYINQTMEHTRIGESGYIRITEDGMYFNSFIGTCIASFKITRLK